MLGFKRIVIGQGERALKFVDRQLREVLTPGVYRWFDPRNRIQLRIYDVSHGAFEHEHIDVFLRDNAELMATHFDQIDVGETELAMLFHDGRLQDLRGPGTRPLIWRTIARTAVQRVDIKDEIAIDGKTSKALTRGDNAKLGRIARQHTHR